MNDLVSIFRTKNSSADDSTPVFGATDVASSNFNKLLSLFANSSSTPGAGTKDLEKALNNLFGDIDDYKEKGKEELTLGMTFKALAAASDTFSRLTGVFAGQTENIQESADIAQQNYDNQMAALDNQVEFLKNQLADRFNKTVQTNMVNMAAKNLRVSGANVLELSKDVAQETTEDIRMAESNAELKKIALRAGKSQAKESARYAEKQMWTGLVSSASTLGIMGAYAMEKGGFGNLFSDFNNTSETESLNTLYKE